MQNLGLTRDRFFGSDQSQPGSALDAFVQAIFPPFAIMRNAQAMFDPKYAPGTIFGLGQGAYQGGKGLLGFGSTPEGGLLGQSPYTSGYSIGNDGGFLNTGWGAQPYGQATTIDDAYSEIGDYAGFDSPSWTSQDEQSYADEIGVSEY